MNLIKKEGIGKVNGTRILWKYLKIAFWCK